MPKNDDMDHMKSILVHAASRMPKLTPLPYNPNMPSKRTNLPYNPNTPAKKVPLATAIPKKGK